MLDTIIDTNVLIVASLVPAGATGRSHRTPAECERVFEWVEKLRFDPAHIVLDNGMKIFDEYHNKLTPQDFGLLVIYEKMMQCCRFYEILHEVGTGDVPAIVPDEFALLDPSDRKFLAVALADMNAGHMSEIVNATDTDDWLKIAVPCEVHGVRIRHLLDE
jgi:predicted nucleic acid-binding protein